MQAADSRQLVLNFKSETGFPQKLASSLSVPGGMSGSGKAISVWIGASVVFVKRYLTRTRSREIYRSSLSIDVASDFVNVGPPSAITAVELLPRAEVEAITQTNHRMAAIGAWLICPCLLF